MLELGVKFLLSYFVGSFLGSMIMGRLCGGVDIRTMGSGNAGGTNALRTQGWLFALGVMAIDVGKGAIGAGLVPAIELPWGNDPTVSREWLAVTCGAAVVLGHVWPMWHNFRGGKGAATLLGTLVVLGPAVIVPVLAVWAAVLALTGYVGLATILAGIAAPVYVGIMRLPHEQPLFIYCLVLAICLTSFHRANIGRMLAGTEARNRSALLFRRHRGQTVDGDER